MSVGRRITFCAAQIASSMDAPRAFFSSRAEVPMKRQISVRWLVLLIVSLGLGASDGVAQSIGNLFQMMGGMDTVGKLSSNLLKSSASDPRLAGVLGKVDAGAVSPKLADQMCSMLGGGCKAPLTDQQIAAGAGKLD